MTEPVEKNWDKWTVLDKSHKLGCLVLPILRQKRKSNLNYNACQKNHSNIFSFMVSLRRSHFLWTLTAVCQRDAKQRSRQPLAHILRAKSEKTKLRSWQKAKTVGLKFTAVAKICKTPPYSAKGTALHTQICNERGFAHTSHRFHASASETQAEQRPSTAAAIFNPPPTNTNTAET